MGLMGKEKIGTLDQRVKIMVLNTSRNDFGEEIGVATELAEIFAKRDFKTVGSKEAYSANRLTEFRVVVWTIRYPRDFDVTAKNLIRDSSGRDYDVESVIEIGRKEYLEITSVLRQ